MAFITGVLLLDAPASALNNAGAQAGSSTDNTIAVKSIRTSTGKSFPYVSSQAYRYWLRSNLGQRPGSDWRNAPIFREKKIAYTDANPLLWWDDDLLGYMRAEGTKKEAIASRAERVEQTATATTITRVSPFRVGTLVSIAPVTPTSDFGTMSRHEGDPVPHEHQFYRAVLKGLVSLDLKAAGTFSYLDRTGYLNLDKNRVEMAEKYPGIEHLAEIKSYRLPVGERIQRITALLQGMAELSGGAKQALHYTDVTPAALMVMVTKGGNNPLQYLVGPDANGAPVVNTKAMQEMIKTWNDQILSPLYIGWVEGFAGEQRSKLQTLAEELNDTSREGPHLPFGAVVEHPREILKQLAASLPSNTDWLK